MAVYPVLLVSTLFVSVQLSVSQFDDFIYEGFRDPKTNLTLTGVAQIDHRGVLQLTNDTSRLIGHAFHSSPIRFKNSTAGAGVYSFSTAFVFAIHPEYPKLGGHGFAFIISPDNNLRSGLPSQYLGMLNSSDIGNSSNHIFAVEFDTVRDFEFDDVNDNHVGVDLNSLKSTQAKPAAYFAGAGELPTEINLKSGKPIVAWIDYDSTTNFINVTISPTSSKPKTPLLSLQSDLSPILHETMYVGFTASTGLLASAHYILGWSFKMNSNGGSQFLDLTSLPSVPGPKKKPNSTFIIALSMAAILFLLISTLIALYLIRKFKNREVIESWELEIGPHRYKYHELKKATRGFKDSELLGFGGFGKVYKGKFPNSKTLIAVKRISHESKQGLREFVSEISTIGRLRHRNLVQLLGWCRRGADLLLVYDFMPNGSLDRFLFDKPNSVLNWAQRVLIIKDVASGLLYLHEGCEQIVIHRDLKTSNVLLDGEMRGKIGDFGLAKLYDHGSNPSTTRVVGTLGYLAPELPRTGRATTGSDVFAFGTLLLEMTCGRRPIESRPGGGDDSVLVDIVWNQWREGRILDAVDARMEGDFDENEAVVILKLGIMCSSNDLAARPSMRQVVSYLEGETVVPEKLQPPSAPGDEKGFEDYVHSYASSSFDKTSSSIVDRSFPSFSTSPLTPLGGAEAAR
ncbi:L-type lectin-domain containing receptor kinase S.4-like [Andrographis paniculata]|uniref:L-type lectin-domain containing receptor kinase S.4-like n=1 Tax=Andrographis paniculata TaxID=175694 RepID=UPI0021E76ACA|nr:L-type lectin-domain containing receptor kinase S.4-like [Andrographis paniculata]